MTNECPAFFTKNQWLHLDNTILYWLQRGSSQTQWDKTSFKADDKIGHAHLSLQPIVLAARLKQILGFHLAIHMEYCYWRRAKWWYKWKFCLYWCNQSFLIGVTSNMDQERHIEYYFFGDHWKSQWCKCRFDVLVSINRSWWWWSCYGWQQCSFKPQSWCS